MQLGEQTLPQCSTGGASGCQATRQLCMSHGTGNSSTEVQPGEHASLDAAHQVHQAARTHVALSSTPGWEGTRT